MDLQTALQRHGNLATRSDLIALGVPTKVIAESLRKGQTKYYGQGLVGIGTISNSWLALRRSGAKLGCVSAAKAHGLWVLKMPGIPHLSVSRTLPELNYTLHRCSKKLTLMKILHQCILCLPTVEALVIVEDAVNKKLISLVALREELGAVRSRKIHTVLSNVRPGSGSGLETYTRYILEEDGHTVVIQKWHKDVGKLDLEVDGILYIETDGRQFHSGPAEFEEDRRRHNVLMRDGRPYLRVTHNFVIHQKEDFLVLVNETLNAFREGKFTQYWGANGE